MGAWVDDSVHVKIEIIKLFTIGVGLGRIDRDLLPIDLSGALLNHGGDDLGVFG